MHFVHLSVQAGVFMSPGLQRRTAKRKDGGAQLKRMESGSLLAICAMCFSISFLVMIPSSLLMTQREKRQQKSQKSVSLHIILGLPCHGKSKEVTESRDAHAERRSGALVLTLWLSSVLTQSHRESGSQWEIRAT